MAALIRQQSLVSPKKGYVNHSEAIHEVADYIVNFYNAVRLHSELGNLSSNPFEYQSATQPTY